MCVYKIPFLLLLNHKITFFSFQDISVDASDSLRLGRKNIQYFKTKEKEKHFA